MTKLYPDMGTASALMSLACDLLRDDHELVCFAYCHRSRRRTPAHSRTRPAVMAD